MAVLTVVGCAAIAFDRAKTRATAREWLGVAWLGVADAANVACFFAAYRRTTVAIAVLTHYLTPLLVALAAPIVLRERVQPRSLVALVVSLVGLACALGPTGAGAGTSHWLGALLGATSAVFFASNVLVNKRLAHAFSASELMGYHGLVATPLLAAMVPREAWAVLAEPSSGWLFVGALGPGAIAGLLFVAGLRRIPASHASALTYLEPLTAIVLGSVRLGERPGVIGWVGVALVLASGALVLATPAPHDRRDR